MNHLIVLMKQLRFVENIENKKLNKLYIFELYGDKLKKTERFSLYFQEDYLGFLGHFNFYCIQNRKYICQRFQKITFS